MRRPQEIAADEANMAVISGLTNAFQGLASMRIAQIKNQVLQSQQFFSELWQLYAALRVDSLFRFGRGDEETVTHKKLLIAVTAEGGFSGDIDQRLIQLLLKEHDPAKEDIVVIGRHGAVQLRQRDVTYVKSFKLPSHDDNINVAPVVALIRQYESAEVYYQTYISLTVQDVKRIELQKAVALAGKRSHQKAKSLIDESTYIFEPSSYAVVAHLERSMLEITLSQVILESKLAQYASRFRAMSAAHERASDSLSDLHRLYNRTRRMIADERLKEITNSRRGVVV